MKGWKKLLAAILAIAVMISGISMPGGIVKADSGVAPVSISLNDTFVSGTIREEGAANFYEVSLPSDGWLTVTYQGWDIGDAYYSISNESMTKTYSSTEVWTSTNISPKTHTTTLAVEAGKYIFKVWPYGNHTGDYKIKASFKAAGNNEASDNNEFRTAQVLSKNQLVTGFLSEDDTVDFYQIQLPSKQTVQIIYTARIADSYFQVWNGDNTERHKREVYYASETQPQTYVYEETLDPGIYYIQIYPYGSNRGRYTLQWNEKIMTKSLSISSSNKTSVVAGKKVKLSVKFNPSNTTVKTVEWKTSDYSTAEVDQSGNVTTKRPGVVNITATATDGSNKFAIYTLIVKPKKTSKPTLSVNSYSKSMYVSYGAQYGSTGYQVQYALNKSFKSPKKKKTTSSSITLSNLKKKKKYYVRVRAYVKNGKNVYYGAWSKVSSKKIK